MYMIPPLKKLIKPLLSSVALVIILLAVLIQAGRLLAPQISQFHHSLEGFASQQSGYSVRFGQLNARWYGLRPSLTVNNLKVQTANQQASDKQTMLSARHLDLELDILSSLFHWAPVWRKLTVQGLSLTLSEDGEGRWSMGGLSPTTDDGLGLGLGLDERSPGALFLVADQLDIDTAQVTFLFHNQQQFTATIPAVNIDNDGQFHRLSAQASIDEGQLGKQDSWLQLVLEGTGDPADADHFSAKAHLNVNDFPIEGLAFLLTQEAEAALPEPASGSTVDMNIWLDWTSAKRVLLQGDVQLSVNKTTDFARDNFLDIPFTANLLGDYAIDSGFKLSLREARIDNKIDVSDAHFTFQAGKLAAAIKQLDLAVWEPWSRERMIRSSNIQAIMSSLSPKGLLENIHIDFDFADIWNTRVKANVANIAVAAWNKVPAFNNITGFVDSNLKEGFIFIDSRDLELHAKKIYKQPLLFDQASGYIRWLLPPDKTMVTIYGQQLSVASEFGRANANFLLTIPAPTLNAYSNLLLQVGLQHSAAHFHRQLKPDVLPENLTAWMDEAILGGDVKQAGLFYRGGLSTGTERSVQLYGELEHGQLAFSPDWPQINAMKGQFLLDNKRLRASIDHASFYSDDRFSGDIHWNWDGQKKLAVNATGRSAAQAALRFVNESWLHSKTNGVFDDWSSEGDVDLSLNLSLPLLDDTVASRQKIRLDFNNNRINLNQQGLSLDKVEGALFYQSEYGFTSDNLATDIFGYRLPLRFAGGVDNVLVSGSATADVKLLSDWLNKPLDSMLTGALPYTLKVRVPLSERPGSKETPVIVLNSDLKGLAIDLPAPFGKRSDVPRSASMAVNYFSSYAR